MDFTYLHPADQLVLFMDRIYKAGLTTTSGGNLSIIDENGDIWITPSGIDKGSLTRHDIMCVKADGTVIGPHKPSMEYPFHSSVYKKRTDLKAVFHAHPPALVSFSLARVLPDVNLIAGIRAVCGKISMAPYAVPGSTQLGIYVSKEFDKGFNAVIMENHGGCVASPSAYQAFMTFDALETCALTELYARKLGKPQPLTESQLQLAEKFDGNRAMPQFMPDHHGSEECALRRDMVQFVHRCCAQHLFSSYQGTYSACLSDGSFLITPEGKDRLWLEENDLVLIKQGKREAGKIPSQSVLVHQSIYAKHPEIRSLAGAQPCHAMAFAVTGTPIDSRTIPESYIQLRNVGEASFEDVYNAPDRIADIFTPKTQVVLCRSSQVLAAGVSLVNAYDRLEVAEATAYSLIASRDVGPLVRISDADIDEINTAFNLPK